MLLGCLKIIRAAGYSTDCSLWEIYLCKKCVRIILQGFTWQLNLIKFKNRYLKFVWSIQMAAFPEFVNQKQLANFLQIPQSTLSDLIRNGVIEREGRRKINFSKAVSAYYEHKIKKANSQPAGSGSQDRLRETRIEEIGRKMQREDKELVTMTETMETIDHVSGVLDGMLECLPRRLTKSVRERQRIEAVVSADRKSFAKHCSDLKQKLLNGAV